MSSLTRRNRKSKKVVEHFGAVGYVSIAVIIILILACVFGDASTCIFASIAAGQR